MYILYIDVNFVTITWSLLSPFFGFSKPTIYILNANSVFGDVRIFTGEFRSCLGYQSGLYQRTGRGATLWLLLLLVWRYWLVGWKDGQTERGIISQRVCKKNATHICRQFEIGITIYAPSHTLSIRTDIYLRWRASGKKCEKQIPGLNCRSLCNCLITAADMLN